MTPEINLLIGFLQSIVTWIQAGLSSFSTPFITVLTGALVYAIGHTVVKLGVEPVQELSELRGKIAEDLTYYANRTTSPGAASGEERIEVGDAYRENASLLSAKAHKIPCYRFWEFLGLVPDIEDVKEARSELIGLSNRVPMNKGGTESHEKMENVISHLELDLEEEYTSDSS